MAFDKTQWVWQDGKMVAWKDATTHISANGLQYGTGVFEGIRCYETPDGPAVFRMDAHMKRFSASAATYELEIPYSQAELEDAICETIRRNGFTNCYIRPVCFLGSAKPGIRGYGCPVHVGILAWVWEPLLGDHAQTDGIHVTISKWVKFHSSMMPATAKACGGYLNSLLAARDANHRGFDESILLNAQGDVAEGSTENVFVVKNHRILTNDENSSILLGVTRDSMIQIARDLGYTVEIGRITVDDLRNADEAFLTGTAAELIPIRELDGSPIGSGKRGPVTTKIQETFFAAIRGRLPQYKHWLHPVSASVLEVPKR